MEFQGYKVLIKFRLKQIFKDLFKKTQFTEQTISIFNILSNLMSGSSWIAKFYPKRDHFVINKSGYKTPSIRWFY